MKPWIDREKMKTVTIKVGQDVEFDVPVRGEPPPEKKWTFNEQPIDDKKIKVGGWRLRRPQFLAQPDRFRSTTRTTARSWCCEVRPVRMLAGLR